MSKTANYSKYFPKANIRLVSFLIQQHSDIKVSTKTSREYESVPTMPKPFVAGSHGRKIYFALWLPINHSNTRKL